MAVVAARCSVTDGHLSVQRLSLSATPALLKLAFLAYPLVTNVAFEAFSCYDFELQTKIELQL